MSQEVKLLNTKMNENNLEIKVNEKLVNLSKRSNERDTIYLGL